ncbi:SDR family NAD(P)-dependent oxidoreductase [Kitasatospora viridis]|uniref:Gluconate 5-dehydrogenase n=1 Tax=Kitasatospora viridis TaxID=281105 RepID=A0A561TTN4_9ACTN|nr:SDR family oxidoreductase [Kitasatospora viridis]TWF90491.1 gluconate 5-dehydrogenase [Kitasatospora viridis]
MDTFLADLFSLKGRTALVTGGSSGIGRAIAEALCRAGARVLLAARSEDQLEETAADFRAFGGEVDWIRADLATRDGVRELIGQADARHGSVDVLVNSAGINLRPPMDELSESDWDVTMAVNLDAPFLLGQHYGPAMAARGWGRIINVGSQQTIRAFGNSGAYGVSKAAIAALTRSQAEAWSAAGVCANAIAPGFVQTPLTEPVFRDPARVAALAARTMTGRNGEQADFTGIALFLAGDACAYVTGQTIFVDGGFSAT